MSVTRSAGLALAMGLVFAANATAQVRTIRLTNPDLTVEEAFSMLQGLREMPDGRILLADPLGQALIRFDPRTGRADTLGGVGAGPAEYSQPDGLFAMPGDSTLLVDLGNTRLTAIGPSGRFGPTMPIAQGDASGPGLGGMMLVLPQGTDRQGRIYFQASGFGGPGGPPDSVKVVRLDRATGRFDTIATLKAQEFSRATSGGPNNQRVMIQPVPFSPRDGWAVAQDGRIGIVRTNGYYVEWIQPDGQVTRGSQVAFEPVRIRAADREEWADQRSGSLRISMDVTGGRQRMTMGRGGGQGGGSGDGLDNLPWPEVKPPFNPSGVRADPSGILWVERSVPAGQPRTYDLFNASGALTAQVVLPNGRSVVGFGKNAVYVVWRDEFDLQYLERYHIET